MQDYFEHIEAQVQEAYAVAGEARKKGLDPLPRVEIPLARNMAERVEGLVGAVAPQIINSGIVKRIQELEKQFGILDWRVALTIAVEVAEQKFCTFKDKREAMEVGIRVGFAYVTVGVVASPLEGFVELQLKKRRDEKPYFSLMYSGPVRSAGGTAGAVSVLIADYVRVRLGYAPYDPTPEEIKRAITEISDYHERVTNLQYLPSEEEIRFLVTHLPVQIDGDPSEKFEVSNYKDLPRIETNRIRNGICLILAECLAQKAPKINFQLSRWGKEMGLDHWAFLEEFVTLQKKFKAKGQEKGIGLQPDYTFIKDLVAGRPILTHPLRVGGFRLRYGRCRTSGFSADAIHPATMVILDDFIAIGAQLKTERPGKSTVVASCDTIEGPIIKLKSGSVLLLETLEQARKHNAEVDEILFLGDILVNYGDFFNRAHKLVPCGYNEDWYACELAQKGLSGLPRQMSAEKAIQISKQHNLPLHPRYTYHWKDITKDQLLSLLRWVAQAAIDPQKVILPLNYSLSEDITGLDPKRVLELLGVPHTVVSKEHAIIEKDDAIAFLASLSLPRDDLEETILSIQGGEETDVLTIINTLAGFPLRDKSGTFIGARMGRPEKAKMRKLTGSPHVLFPVGAEGGRLRSFQSALAKGRITAEFPLFFCPGCSRKTIYAICEECRTPTLPRSVCPICKTELSGPQCPQHHEGVSFCRQQLDIPRQFQSAVKMLKLKAVPELVKGVRGTSNKGHVPEHLAKGLLRAAFNLYVNKEGTIRYDMTEMPLTAFKPKEIGTSLARLKELGYDQDMEGKPLEHEDQILELKVQDVVLPEAPDALDEGAGKVLFRVSRFIDTLLSSFYGLPPFYKLSSEADLAGHLVVGLSPHTSAGVVARIIGFSRTQVFLAHPLFHSLMRRDADGDEACVILLLDTLINFSRLYLPSHRGAIQDAPLVLTSKIIPTEVDDMAFHLDMVPSYPLEIYEAAQQHKDPWAVKIDQLKQFLGTPRQYSGFWFTHDTSDLNNGVRCSAYKKIPSMQEKVQGQMALAEKIRAVDEADVARLLIERHFIRDIKGNLRKFSMQEFRCVDCNEKYRRPPLIGRCKCGGKLLFTIAEGSITKYLEPSLQLVERYALPAYLKQTVELTKNRIESFFGKAKEKQEGLTRWF